jgi:hypothetical protein
MMGYSGCGEQEGDEYGGGGGKWDTGIKPTNRQRNTTLRFWDHDAAEWL